MSLAVMTSIAPSLAPIPLSSSLRNMSATRKLQRVPPYQWVDASLYIFILLYTIMIINIVLSNITVIIAYTRMSSKLKKKMPNILLLNQSFVDLFIGISVLPHVFCASGFCPNVGHTVITFFVEYSTFLALGVLLIGTLERLIMVKFPFVHRKIVAIHRMAGLLVFTWIVTLIPALVYSSSITDGKNRELNDRYHIIVYCILAFVMILVYIFLGLTYQHIRSAIAKRPCHKTKDNFRPKQGSQKKVARVFMLMSLVYTITIVPHIIGTIILASSTKIPLASRETRTIIKTSLHLFYISSSLMNPIITMMGKPDYKEILLLMLGKGKGKEIAQSRSKEQSTAGSQSTLVSHCAGVESEDQYPLKLLMNDFSGQRSSLTKYEVL